MTDGSGAGAERFAIPTALVEHVLLGPADDRRVLQDSPILGDVWLAYAADPSSSQDLLITPHVDATAAAVAAGISKGLEGTERAGVRQREAGVAYLQGIVAARLRFDEVLRVLVPMTQWHRMTQWYGQRGTTERGDGTVPLAPKTAPDRARMRHVIQSVFSLDLFRGDRLLSAPGTEGFTALERYLALVGLILWAAEQNGPASDRPPPQAGAEDVLNKITPDVADRMVGILGDLGDDVLRDAKARGRGRPGRRQKTKPLAADPEEAPEGALIFQISLNRRPVPALERSVPAVKADAARTLFDIRCDKIVWAVLDAGIEGTHDAFMVKGERKPFSRVRKTFDFTNIRAILSTRQGSIEDGDLDRLLNGADLGEGDPGRRREQARERLALIARDAKEKRPVNWDVVEELITLNNPPRPPGQHGTHVAGIIGADPNGNGKASGNAGGMCPDIRLYDFRVLAKSATDTEFAVIAALQYIRYVNERHSYTTIHGANLSLSIPHNVRNYACGRTPVCNECERLVDSGVVVVAAAGNRGYHNFETKDGVYEGYAAFSITDPGNSDGVITVGATHGNWPHTYGVSFFSSRGPTGDGRLKPDLVAPGERIRSTVPGGEWGAESGTSMAAPHVSGAAAMLLARYSELIGQPRRVKRILCESATDLGRERSFQGHGMLDVLRALQSI